MSGALETQDDQLIAAVATGRSGDPFAVLGRHAVIIDGRPAVILRTLQPSASSVELITPGRVTPMSRRHPDGLFEARIPLEGSADELAYRFRVHEPDRTNEIVDPYQFGQVLSDFDLHLFSEGTHYRAWEKLGSHLTTIGGIAGVRFAVWAPNAQRVSVVGDFNRWDGRVHARPREADVLRERAASPHLGGWLVAAEIAMAMMLLVGGGLLMHSFYKLATADRGYDAAHVITFQATGRPAPGPQTRAFAESLVDRIAAIPGVTAAGYANNLPLVQQGFGRDVYPASRQVRRPQPGLHAISPRFTTAMGLRIVEGRGFSEGEAARHEALVTRAFAGSAFFDGPALGSQIYAGRDQWEVVGILDDLNQFSLQQRPNPEMFIVDFVPPPPGLGGSYFAVRTSIEPGALFASVRGIVRQLDPNATVDNMATMDQIVSNAMSQPRLYAVLLAMFAAVAVALAAIGIYGVLGFIVTHRRREIGIRIALGARPGQVMTLILRQTAVVTIVGVIAGVIGAASFSRYLEGLLFGVTPLDVATFAAVIAVFAAVAALAASVPARRATRIEPQVALRAE